MAQKAKCLTRKINHLRTKQFAEAVRMKNVRRNIKIRCEGKMHGISYREIEVYRKWLVFSNIFKFVFFRD